MRLAILILILCLPLAAAQEYWTVVGDDINDVINAANFAGSMKASLGVSFTGKTEDQAMTDLRSVDADEVLAVYFDGDVVVIRAGRGFNEETDMIERYLDEQGFDVRFDDFPEPRAIPREEVEPEPEQEQAPEPEIEHQPVVVDQRVQEAPEPEEAPQPPPPPEPEERPGVFSRLWRWFVGVFT